MYKSSVDGEVTVVVSVFGVDGVACTDGALYGPASSVNRTFDGVECFFIRVRHHQYLVEAICNSLEIMAIFIRLIGEVT